MKFRGGMNELMRQASRLQRKIDQRKEELKAQQFEATSGNDRVKAVATGGGDLVSVSVDPKLLEEEGLEMVQDLLVAAVNASLKKARDTVDVELEKVTGGLKIPGMT